MSNTNAYSGTVLSQTATPSHLLTTDLWVYQEFVLPADYARGERIPPLTGFEIILDATTTSAALEWVIEHDVFGVGWTTLMSGSTSGCHASGTEVGFDVYTPTPIVIASPMLSDTFRVGIHALTDIGGYRYSLPNPLATRFVKATAADGTALLDGGQEFSFMFHILGWVADSGIDLLGNQYRSAVISESVNNVATTDAALKNAFWLSKPNPSKFAVECLYFDVSANDAEVVIDRILLDPMTPDVFFSVYFTSEGDPGTTIADWQSKLWHRVPFTYQMKRRETFALPRPISARYICLEFTHLREQAYAPGDYQKPLLYQKHPKWVLDYFLLRTATDTSTTLVPRKVTVNYNAISLAYDYYLDDLHQAPLGPDQLIQPSNALNQFLVTRNDVSDLIDGDTLRKINLVLDEYTNDPALRGKNDFILSDFVAQQSVSDQTPEVVPTFPPVDTQSVSSLDRSQVIFDLAAPVMYFYVDCRHVYREAYAMLDHDRAYFAGIRELAFFRDHYNAVSDEDVYVETGADTVNCERNDFAAVNGVLQTYNSTL